jgi:asparagine synthase (glutamine-hydrolysing)
MCGIAGLVATTQRLGRDSEFILSAISGAMRARGPDGDGLWLDDQGRAALAHRRLSIIDLSTAGQQPMASSDGSHVLVFNGEIYNYQALRDELEAVGQSFQSHSDTEVILHLFRREGVAMLPRLRGMFAFAIWDGAAQELTVARDAYGIKPLYYAHVQGAFRFASQVKALACDPAISRTLSPEGLAGFHLMGSVPEPFTILNDVRACPAGSWIKVANGTVSAPVAYTTLAQIASSGAAAPPRSTRELLLDTMRHHLVADVPVGAFLSGGVDSGAIIGLMRDCGQESITGCTLRFEEFAGTPADEGHLAAEMARHYGVEHHVHTVTQSEFRADLDAIFAAMDQPSIDGFNIWFVSKATRALGLKVALSGLGGDELMGGYSTFQTLPSTYRRFGGFARIPGLGAASRAAITTLAPQLARQNPKAAGVLSHAGSWGGTYLLRRAVLLPYELDGAMDAGLVRQGLKGLDIETLMALPIDGAPDDDFSKVSLLESANYMRNQLLRDADWAGMAHSLEIRVPLVDTMLLHGMAAHFQDLAQGSGKRTLAAAPSKPLPASVVNREKTGFQTPMPYWLNPAAKATGDRTATRLVAKTIFDHYAASLTR